MLILDFDDTECDTTVYTHGVPQGRVLVRLYPITKVYDKTDEIHTGDIELNAFCVTPRTFHMRLQNKQKQGKGDMLLDRCPLCVPPSLEVIKDREHLSLLLSLAPSVGIYPPEQNNSGQCSIATTRTKNLTKIMGGWGVSLPQTTNPFALRLPLETCRSQAKHLRRRIG